MLSVFLPNIKLEQLHATVLKPLGDFGKTIDILKTCCHYCRPNMFSKFPSMFSLVLRPMIHVTGIFIEYQTGATADHSF